MVRNKDRPQAAAGCPDAAAGPSSSVAQPVAKRPPGRPRKNPPAVLSSQVIELNVNQRPRRQIKHKFIKNSSYTSPEADISDTQQPVDPVKRKRGRPKKIRPLADDGSVDVSVAPATPSPLPSHHHSVEILSIGDATVELVEIIPDDDSTDCAASTEQPPPVAVHLEEIETCTIDSEQFELMVVEDESLTEYDVSPAAADEPAAVEQQPVATEDTGIIELSDEDSADQEIAATLCVRTSRDTPSFVITIDDQDSQNSSIVSASDMVMGFDGDRPILNGRTASNLPVPYVRLTKTLAARASTPARPLEAVEVAMQQLVQLGRDHTRELSTAWTSTPTVRSPIVPSSQQNHDEPAPAELSSSDRQPKATIKKCAEVLPGARVTRRNSILFTPKATANNLKALAKLLGKSPAEVARMNPQMKPKAVGMGVRKKAKESSVRLNGVDDCNHLTHTAAVMDVSEEQSSIVPNGDLPHTIGDQHAGESSQHDRSPSPCANDDSAQLAAAMPLDVPPIDDDVSLTAGDAKQSTTGADCDTPLERVEVAAPIETPTEEIVVVAAPIETPTEHDGKTDSPLPPHTKKPPHNASKKERRKSTTTTADNSHIVVNTPTAKVSATKSDSHKSSKSKKHHSSSSRSASDARKSTHRTEHGAATEASRIRTPASTAGDDQPTTTVRSSSTKSDTHKSSHSQSHRQSGAGKTSSTSSSAARHSESGRIRTPGPTANDDQTTKDAAAKSNSKKSQQSIKTSGSGGKSTSRSEHSSNEETVRIRTPAPALATDQTVAVDAASAAAAVPATTPNRLDPATKTDPHKTPLPNQPSTASDLLKSTPSAASSTSLPVQPSSTTNDSAKRAKRTNQRLESTFKSSSSAKKPPEQRLDPYSILSECYMPKQVKHDASLYSIEAMRAARAKADEEAAAIAALVELKPQLAANNIDTDAANKPKFASKAMLKFFDSDKVDATAELPKAEAVLSVQPEIEENWDLDETPHCAIDNLAVLAEAATTVTAYGTKTEEPGNDGDDVDQKAPSPTPLATGDATAAATAATATAAATTPNADEDASNSRRRSGRIKIITETKQRSRGFGLVKDRDRVHTTMTDGTTAAAARDASVSPSDSEGTANGASCTLQPGGCPAADTTVAELPYDQTLTVDQLERYQRDLREGLALFKQIGDNEFRSERNVSKEAKRMTCDCFLTAAEVQRGEYGCGEDCLNRMLMIECGVRCVVGDRCTNKRFQRHQTSDCTIFKTDKKGFGLLANSHIAAGDFIMEYVGEVLNSEQFESRAAEYALEKNRHHYFMALRSDCVIDATIRGNISRFINHSCDPNAETQKWTVGGELRIGFFSTKSIAAGEEITFDYQFQRYGKSAQRCYCEAECCRGWIGEEPESDEEVDEEDDNDAVDDDDTLSTLSDLSSSSSPATIGSDSQPPDGKVTPLAAAAAAAITTTAQKVCAPRGATAKQPRKPRKLTRPKRAEIMEDPHLDMSIDQLERSQLKNRAQTLQFSRLVVRAESRNDKRQMLRILRSGELACRRLFLDYHGLKLLHAWMSDSEPGDDANDERRTGDWLFRLDILQTLAVLPILNKLLLEDSKVLHTVSAWSQLQSDPTAAGDDNALNAAAAASPIACDIPKLLEENSVMQDINLDALKQIITTNEANAKRLSEAKSRTEAPPPLDGHERVLYDIVRLAKRMVTAWSLLPEVFRIPKRQRVEQMKAHERDADRNYRALGCAETGKDEAAAAAAAAVAANRRSAVARPMDPRAGPHRYRPPSASTMQSAPTPTAGMDATAAAQQQQQPHHASFVESPGLSKMQRRQLFEAKVAAERQLSEQQHTHATKCAFFRLNPRMIDEASVPFCVNPATNQWFGVYGHPVYTPPSHMHIKPPPQKKTTNPADYVLPPMDLPEFWAYGIDENGRLYYYHLKIRIPQWEPPIKLLPLGVDYSHAPLTAAAAGIAAATAAAIGDESSSESDSADTNGEELLGKVKQIEAAIAAKRKHIDIMQNRPPDLMAEISALANTDATRAASATGADVAFLLDNSTASVELPYKRRKCRKLLVQERSISPRTDRDRKQFKQEMRRYRENKEKLRRRRNAKRKKHEQSTSGPTAIVVSNAGDGKRPAEPVVGDKQASEAGRLNGDEDDDDEEEEEEEEEEDDGVTATLVNGHVDPDDDVVVDDDDDSGDESAIGAGESVDDADGDATFGGTGRLAKRGAAADEEDRGRWEAARRAAKRKKQSAEQPQMPGAQVQPAAGESALSVEVVKRIKDKFRNKVSGVIVHNLNYYRRDTCTVGYISNDDDFRFLAKKLSNSVLVKELKQRNNMFDALEVTDSVRSKARDFVRKYMQKFGPTYKRSETDF